LVVVQNVRKVALDIEALPENPIELESGRMIEVGVVKLRLRRVARGIKVRGVRKREVKILTDVAAENKPRAQGVNICRVEVSVDEPGRSGVGDAAVQVEIAFQEINREAVCAQ